MEQGNRRWGILVACIAACVLAVVFIVLWIQRGTALQDAHDRIARLAVVEKELVDISAERETAAAALAETRSTLDTVQHQYSEALVREEAVRAELAAALQVIRENDNDGEGLRQELTAALQTIQQKEAEEASLRQELANALQVVREKAAEEESRNQELASLRSTVASTEAKMAAMQAAAASTPASREQMRQPLAAISTKQDGEMEDQRIADLEAERQRLSERIQSLSDEADRARRELNRQQSRHEAIARAADQAWRESVQQIRKASLEKEQSFDAQQKRIADLENRYVAAKAEKESLTRDHVAAMRKIADLEQAHAADREEIADASRRVAEIEELLAGNRKSLADTSRRAKNLEARLNSQTEEMAAVRTASVMEIQSLTEEIDSLREELSNKALDREWFGMEPNGRSVGRIVERLSDGQTLLIEGGVNQRIRPGMKFDVFRPVGTGNRYVGMVRVIRVLEDHAMVVSSYAEINGLVCPVTGRAVLDPTARYSPYAVSSNGEPVELVSSDTVGIPLEAPAVGDLIDNPFYHPERQVAFALAPELADDECLIFQIDILGGFMPSDPADAEFSIASDGTPAGHNADGPRRVDFRYFSRYVDIPPPY